MIYRKFVRPIISRLRPRQVQMATLKVLDVLQHFVLTRKLVKLIYGRQNSILRTEVMGIMFPNPIGLAAGFDRNAQFCDEISEVGFGYVEVGPITPKPEKEPEIANKGLFSTVDNLRDIKPKTLVAANITHNSFTPDEEIVADYDKCFALLYDFADMFVINASISYNYKRSPLEDPETLSDVMDVILERRLTMDRFKPVLIKISPDIPADQLEPILSYSMASGVDGIVAGDVYRNNEKQFAKNLALVRRIKEFTKGRLDIIGCGGILSPADAREMIDAGASLVELYSGIFYEGPVLVRKTLNYLEHN